MNEFVDLLLHYGIFGLALVAFAEASFFPIPPDALLIPLVLAAPEKGFSYALVCTLASTVGGLLGHFLGRKAGRPLLYRLAQRKTLQRVEELFGSYGGWAVAFAALTPIPYKIFTISAGVFLVKKRVVVIGSLAGRGFRFYLEVLLITFMGPAAVNFLKDYSGPLTFGLGLLLVFFGVWYTWRKKRKPV